MISRCKELIVIFIFLSMVLTVEGYCQNNYIGASEIDSITLRLSYDENSHAIKGYMICYDQLGLMGAGNSFSDAIILLDGKRINLGKINVSDFKDLALPSGGTVLAYELKSFTKELSRGVSTTVTFEWGKHRARAQLWGGKLNSKGPENNSPEKKDKKIKAIVDGKTSSNACSEDYTYCYGKGYKAGKKDKKGYYKQVRADAAFRNGDCCNKKYYERGYKDGVRGKKENLSKDRF